MDSSDSGPHAKSMGTFSVWHFLIALGQRGGDNPERERRADGGETDVFATLCHKQYERHKAVIVNSRFCDIHKMVTYFQIC